MKTIYIKEYNNEEILNNKIPKCIRNGILKIIKQFNIILQKEIDENKKIFYMQNINDKDVYNRLRRKIEKEKIKTHKLQVALSNKVKEHINEFKDYTIVNGKKVFEKYIEQILKIVLNKTNLALEDVYVLTNKYCIYSVSFIRKIAPQVKSINIITKEIDKYMIVEEILEKEGLIVSVANNKKKSLKKAKIIINIDFTEDEIKKYIINRNSVIINLSLEKIKQLKLFDGIIIQGIELDLEEEQKIFIKKNALNKDFKNIEIYESFIDKIDISKIQISNLLGNNGKIDKKELINMQKILTN